MWHGVARHEPTRAKSKRLERTAGKQRSKRAEGHVVRINQNGMHWAHFEYGWGDCGGSGVGRCQGDVWVVLR